jgi:hypothetical protein
MWVTKSTFFILRETHRLVLKKNNQKDIEDLEI